MSERASVDVRPSGTGKVVRLGGAGPEVVELAWGLKPSGNRKSPVINVRAEGLPFRTKRCLVPATDFFLFTGKSSPKTRWRATVRGRKWFCFAGIWQPARGNWPESYAVITVPAGKDLERLARRQMAIVERARWRDWLDGKDATGLLQPSPSGSLIVSRD